MANHNKMREKKRKKITEAGKELIKTLGYERGKQVEFLEAKQGHVKGIEHRPKL